MSKKANIKTKGDTNVKCDATMLRKTNIVDVSKAKVKWSGKGDWDSFELLGTSDREEEKLGEEANGRVDTEALRKRLRGSSVWRKIVSLQSLNLDMAS